MFHSKPSRHSVWFVCYCWLKMHWYLQYRDPMLEGRVEL